MRASRGLRGSKLRASTQPFQTRLLSWSTPESLPLSLLTASWWQVGAETTNALRYVWCWLPPRADVNRVVRKRLDVRRASFMTMDNAVGRTQMEFGGITPLGLPAEWPIWVDSRVMRQPWVVIGAGVRAAKLRIRGAAVGDLPGVEVVDGLAAEIG
ncbi:YbaK/EbsC family protein [Ornithinimicrobium sp. INDO-MA30-4]|uniref:YbaK/EbsC family protein n=1 Tax=Ornithinimicrobium sp. INDO-MA30-4 TaxID=2908651 RepID=UPI002882FAB2|nr:YbaK/EbsC family protein [Ornithinimicrobium sp. INDO-MA30-4]